MKSLFTLFGLVIIYCARRELGEWIKSYSWSKVQGLVTSVNYIRTPGINDDKVFEHQRMPITHMELSYRYKVFGAEYTSNRLGFGDCLHPNHLPLAPGSYVTVYFNPSDPSNAVLSRKPPSALWIAVSLIATPHIVMCVL